MASINIQITATLAQFGTFADELGYVDKVADMTGAEPVILPNPETKQQYLERRMKEIVVQELYRRKAQAVDRQIQETKEAEKATIRTGIESVVSVTSKA